MHPLQSRIQLVVDDITQLSVDAVVTAANTALTGGGGVDGAVHAAAGPELLQASSALAPCPAGSAKITRAYRLKAKFVIHAVGPVFRESEEDTFELAGAYQSALSLATGNNVATIAFPCISTGVYGFPMQPACHIAVDTVIRWLKANAIPEIVTFCCFHEQDAQHYRKRLGELGIHAQ